MAKRYTLEEAAMMIGIAETITPDVMGFLASEGITGRKLSLYAISALLTAAVVQAQRSGMIAELVLEMRDLADAAEADLRSRGGSAVRQ